MVLFALLACTRDERPPDSPEGDADTDTDSDSDTDVELPDLYLDGEVLASSLVIEEADFAEDHCAVVEGCVVKPGHRRLLRFTTTTVNLGPGVLVVGKPSEAPEKFHWDECHQHYHLKGYADYSLFDTDGGVAVAGFKPAFCLADNEDWAGTGGVPRYNCADQGLSVGWADVYGYGIDCQWVDITDVEPGTYKLRVEVGKGGLFEEVDLANNVVELEVEIPL